MTEMLQLDDNTPDKVVAIAWFPGLMTKALFNYLVNPELLVQWWPEVAELDLRAGGSYTFTWPSQNWRLFGDILEIEPGQRFSYTWQWEHEPDLPVRTVVVEIEPEENGSRLRLTQGTYSDSAVDQADRQGHIDGWAYFLGRLQELTGE